MQNGENVIYLQKMLYNMNGTVPRTQTAFRLKDSLLERLKMQARRANKSLNSFVEETLEEKVGREIVFPKLPPEFFEQSRELERFAVEGFVIAEEYRGKTAAEQAELDKKNLMEALYEKHCI